MKAICNACGTDTDVRWWRGFSWRRCDFCRWRDQLARSEPEPIAPVPDPLEETEPEDIEVCGYCKGAGEVLKVDTLGHPRVEYDTNAYLTETCMHCAGTGSAFGSMQRVAWEPWLVALGRDG